MLFFSFPLGRILGGKSIQRESTLRAKVLTMSTGVRGESVTVCGFNKIGHERVTSMAETRRKISYIRVLLGGRTKEKRERRRQERPKHLSFRVDSVYRVLSYRRFRSSVCCTRWTEILPSGIQYRCWLLERFD